MPLESITQSEAAAQLHSFFKYLKKLNQEERLFKFLMKRQLAEEARKRQATSTGGANPQLTQIIAEADKGEAREQAAALVGTNRQYVSDAKRGKVQFFPCHSRQICLL